MEAGPHAFATPYDAPSRLWQVTPLSAEPHEVFAIDTCKPCLFFFGGENYLCRGKSSANNQYNQLRRALTDGSHRNPFNFYTLIDDHANDHAEEKQNETVTRARENDEHYERDGMHYYSADASQFVSRYLLPLVDSLEGLSGEARRDALYEAQKHFGSITFFGYSYGTTFIQEVRNALVATLPKRGYNEKEMASLIACLAAVNIGPSFRYTPKYPDITQTTFVWSKDKEAIKATGITLSVRTLEFNQPTPDIAWAERDNHSIIYVNGGSTRLRSVRYPAPSRMDLEDFLQAAQHPSPELMLDEPAIYDHRVVSPHNKQLNIARLSDEVTDDYHETSFPSNLVGMNSMRFLSAYVAASDKALKHDIPRDAGAVAHETITEHLSSTARAISAASCRMWKGR
jgi:hypothetical protein